MLLISAGIHSLLHIPYSDEILKEVGIQNELKALLAGSCHPIPPFALYTMHEYNTI